ncbi:MAG: aa3-type cytochrome c oxidase subunit IV [Thalassobaculum sp.]
MAVEDRFPDITREHREIYSGFMTFLKVSTALCILTVVLLALFVV